MARKSIWERLAVIAIAACAASPSAAQSVTAELSAGRAAYGPAEAITLSLTLRNAGDADAAVLSWKLPFGGIKDDFFVVNETGCAPATRAASTSDRLRRRRTGRGSRPAGS